MDNLKWWMGKLKIPGSMLLLGFGVMYYGNHIVDQSAASRYWPTAMGQVTVSRVEGTTWSKESRSNRYRSSNTETAKTSYGADVQYEYRAQGKPYTGANIRLLMPLESSPAEVQPILDRYPVGKRVTVYFNPQDPGESVLENVVDEDTYLLFYMGIMWSVVWAGVLIVVVIVVYFKDWRKKK